MDTRDLITTLQLDAGGQIVRCRYPNTPADFKGNSRIFTERRGDPVYAPAQPPYPKGAEPWGVGANGENDDYAGAPAGNVYHFKNVDPLLKLSRGDMVVVEDAKGMSIVVVEQVDVHMAAVTCNLGALRNVVAKIDLDRLHRLHEAESRAFGELAKSQARQRVEEFRKQAGGNVVDDVRRVLLSTDDEAVIEED